ncbi:MAG: RsiV family protein [Oscillospiraceae bacterium]
MFEYDLVCLRLSAAGRRGALRFFYSRSNNSNGRDGGFCDPSARKVTDPTQDPTEVAVPSEAPSEGETTPPVTGTQEIPLVAVSLIPVLEEETDENGTTIFRYQYQTITAILPDAPDASEKITSTMEERGKEAAGSVEEILNWARQDYTGDSSWVPYSCQVAFVPARVDATTVSFSGAVWSFSGGVHPNCTRISCSFDAASGDVLTLSDILSNTDVVEALYLKVMDGLDQRSRELDPNQSVWNDGYEEIVREHFNLEHVSSASWYFSDTGMHFYFSPYEIAPYVVGEVDIEIPYAELRGILKEEYFPEATTYEGAFSLNAAHQEQVDSTQFEENILVDLKTDGTKVAVFSGSVIHRVQLEQGSWSAENQQTGIQPSSFCSKPPDRAGSAAHHCGPDRCASRTASDAALWRERNPILFHQSESGRWRHSFGSRRLKQWGRGVAGGYSSFSGFNLEMGFASAAIFSSVLSIWVYI